jgi:hypothetical protein
MRCLEIGPISSRKKFFLVHYDNGLGWHFLDWSIKYLSGKKQDFLFDQQRPTALLQDPIDSTQAHKHRINYVCNREQLIDFDGVIQTLHSDCFPMVLQSYVGQNTVQTGSKQKTDLSNVSSTQREALRGLVDQTQLNLAQLALELGYTVITILWHDAHKLVPGYHVRQPIDYQTGELLDPSVDPHQLWADTFFADSRQRFDHDIWDQRERLALCVRPFFNLRKINFANDLVRSLPDVIALDTRDLWQQGSAIFRSIDADRYRPWLSVYERWQQLHDTKFSEDYWQILDHVINNRSWDLSPYGMNLIKEALLQHGLLYHYDLNVRTWGLERFPNNTQELHLLLEQNIHTLDTEYKGYCENFYRSSIHFACAHE